MVKALVKKWMAENIRPKPKPRTAGGTFCRRIWLSLSSVATMPTAFTERAILAEYTPGRHRGAGCAPTVAGSSADQLALELGNTGSDAGISGVTSAQLKDSLHSAATVSTSSQYASSARRLMIRSVCGG
jgi:hypothetical protein